MLQGDPSTPLATYSAVQLTLAQLAFIQSTRLWHSGYAAPNGAPQRGSVALNAVGDAVCTAPSATGANAAEHSTAAAATSVVRGAREG